MVWELHLPPISAINEINDARTFLFAVEVDEEGNEITADEEYQQKMTDLMIKKAEEAEAVSKEAGKK